MIRNRKYHNNDLDPIYEELKQIKALLINKERPFLTLDEASAYLGGISKFTLYGYTSKQILPFYKLQGRKLYFKIEDLDRFVLNAKNRVKSKEEIDSEAATKLLMSDKR